MLKKILAHLGMALLLLFGQSVYAGSGLLFNVASSGAPGNVSINLCLNGNGPLSCQNFNVSALTLTISPTVPNHVYPAIGIKINTPGYSLANLGIACTPITNGYCLFSASQAAPKTLIIKPSNTNTVGGTVTGLTGTVTLLNNGADSTPPISTDGPFTFSTPVAQGGTYSVTIGTQPAGQTCSVANGSGTMGAANITNVTVTCSTNSYSVGGTITGLTGTVRLLNNGANSTPYSTNGSFTFSTPLAQGSPYSVTVETQPTNQTCSVANGSGTMSASNITNVTVTCSTNSYTVGGTITGLIGTVTLLNNGGNSTPFSSSPFTFSTPVAQGSPYSVTVGAQPATQACSVANGSGTIGAANVTNVAVTCVTANTTLSVSATGTIPVNNGTNTLTVRNTGTSFSAANVHAVLPVGWTGVTQNASECTLIAPNGGTCTLILSSTTPYVAKGGIVITGDNITSPPTTALAFTATSNNYLIWAVSGTTVQVIDTTDLSSPNQWGGYGIAIGITAQSLTNGSSAAGTLPAPDNTAGNTYAIVTNLGPGSYAADSCYTSTNGGASSGTWYLPAVCQMGGAGGYAGCSSGLANIQDNLVQLGFGGLFSYYWSSTEDSSNPQYNVWGENFTSTPGGGQQISYYKNYPFGVRCSRALSLP
jgi:hypothetical protein